MHITLEADYAIRIVYCLAKEKKRVEAKSISEMTGVTLRFSLKILRKLVSAEIIKSYKGTQGGYELAKPAEKISLYDIIKVIEGEYNFSKCGLEEFVCTRRPNKDCTVRKVFLGISQEVIKRLEDAKIADLICD